MWLDKEGRKFKAARGKPTYLLGHNQPFPLNPAFKSQSVLSEESREEIWQRVIVQGEALKAVSAKFGVDMRRVAAVVRLKEVEKTWEAQVSWKLFLSHRPLYPIFRSACAVAAFMMITFKNSISLEDNNHGYKRMLCEPL